MGNNNLDMVKELIKAVFDINRKNLWNLTPLAAAIQKGFLPIAKELINAGTDFNVIDKKIFDSPMNKIMQKYLKESSSGQT